MANAELAKLLKNEEELDKQKLEISKKIQELRRAERKPILDDIKAKIKEYGFTISQLGLKAKKAAKTEDGTPVVKKKAVAKYRNEKNEEWAGRGIAPKWMKGADGKVSEALKKKYAIKK